MNTTRGCRPARSPTTLYEASETRSLLPSARAVARTSCPISFPPARPRSAEPVSSWFDYLTLTCGKCNTLPL